MRTSLAFLFFFAATAAPVLADSGFRCSTGRLVSVGDRMSDVLDHCGEPDATVERTEKRKVKHKITRRVGGVEESVTEEEEIEIPITEWTYDMGPRAFTRYVIFENGAVVNVATGKYGR